ncbi:MAG TPA: hypothetical protein VHB79_31985 [Polyangiaceae bacterium]|nr:hypothetical protein [Polyangiaceae bacterium]
MSLGARLWQSFKQESKVALRTFGVAWLVLTLALSVWCLIDSPQLHGPGDALLMLSFGTVVCSFYTFWPALIVATCRGVYRLLGWGAYVGAALIVAGVLVSLALFRHPLGALVAEVFASGSFSGPCGAHAGGGVGAALALVCIVMAVVTSPASWWALGKLFLLLSLAALLGAMPGTALWLVLIARKVVRVAKTGDSR